MCSLVRELWGTHDIEDASLNGKTFHLLGSFSSVSRPYISLVFVLVEHRHRHCHRQRHRRQTIHVRRPAPLIGHRSKRSILQKKQNTSSVHWQVIAFPVSDALMACDLSWTRGVLAGWLN